MRRTSSLIISQVEKDSSLSGQSAKIQSMKIYTKGGDRGTTSLFGGERVEKNSLRIRAYGEIDELNSLIGVILAEWSNVEVEPRQEVQPLRKKLLRIQQELFVLGADLATPYAVKVKVPRIGKIYIKRLEKEIDNLSKQLSPLKKFILPGGSQLGSKLHLARTIARRAERSIVHLASEEKIDKNAIVYINRLSDWLFVLARYANKLGKNPEIAWKGRSKI